MDDVSRKSDLSRRLQEANLGRPGQPRTLPRRFLDMADAKGKAKQAAGKAKEQAGKTTGRAKAAGHSAKGKAQGAASKARGATKK